MVKLENFKKLLEVPLLLSSLFGVTRLYQLFCRSHKGNLRWFWFVEQEQASVGSSPLCTYGNFWFVEQSLDLDHFARMEIRSTSGKIVALLNIKYRHQYLAKPDVNVVFYPSQVYLSIGPFIRLSLSCGFRVPSGVVTFYITSCHRN